MTARALQRALSLVLVLVLFHVIALRTAQEQAPRSQALPDIADGRWNDPQAQCQAISMGSADLGRWQFFRTRMPHD